MLRHLLPALFRWLDWRLLRLAIGSDADGAPRPSAARVACYSQARQAAAELQKRHPRHAAPKEATRQLDYLLALETDASRDTAGLGQVDLEWLACEVTPLDPQVSVLIGKAAVEARYLSWYG